MADGLNKQYVLMHKNVPVADIELDAASRSISAIGRTRTEDYVPRGDTGKEGKDWPRRPQRMLEGPVDSCQLRWNSRSHDRTEEGTI